MFIGFTNSTTKGNLKMSNVLYYSTQSNSRIQYTYYTYSRSSACDAIVLIFNDVPDGINVSSLWQVLKGSFALALVTLPNTMYLQRWCRWWIDRNIPVIKRMNSDRYILNRNFLDVDESNYWLHRSTLKEKIDNYRKTTALNRQVRTVKL